jgi:hypothetical protein
MLFRVTVTLPGLLVCASVPFARAGEPGTAVSTAPPAAHSQPATTPPGPKAPDSDRRPLDTSVLERIESWRSTLASARCLKVVEDAVRITTTDAAPGQAAEHSITRVEGHAWMTPDSLWLVIYPSRPRDAAAGPSADPQARTIDRSRPDVQLLWRNGRVLERIWDPAQDAYRVRAYPCTDSSGPGDFDYGENCSLGDISESWLAPGSSIIKSIGLEYNPEERLTPPRASSPSEGTWITLGIDQVQMDPSKSKMLYSRIDDVLLDATNQVREWHSRVTTTNPVPGRITARRSYTFQFLAGKPAALDRAMDDFESLVTAALAADSQPISKGSAERK